MNTDDLGRRLLELLGEPACRELPAPIEPSQEDRAVGIRRGGQKKTSSLSRNLVT